MSVHVNLREGQISTQHSTQSINVNFEYITLCLDHEFEAVTNNQKVHLLLILDAFLSSLENSPYFQLASNLFPKEVVSVGNRTSKKIERSSTLQDLKIQNAFLFAFKMQPQLLK